MKNILMITASLLTLVVASYGAASKDLNPELSPRVTVQAATTLKASKDKADKKDKPDKKDKTSNTDKADKKDKSSDADKAGKKDKTSDADKAGNKDKTSDADKAGKKDKSSNADKASNNDKVGKTVYFAAPLFNDAERTYNLKIVSILESYGYEVFLPQRDGFLAPELEGLTEEQKIKKIFEKDRDEVLKADIFFGVLDGRIPDEGVCVELGMAYMNGKRCYGLKSDARSVELDMDLNPMISGSLDKLFYNLNGEELIKSLEDYLKENDL